MMTLEEIAAELVAGCREGREKENLGRLYAPDAVSVEGADMGGQGAETRGLAGIRAKHEWWEGAHIVHCGTVEGPFTHQPDRFAVIFDIDAENRETGERNRIREVGVYTVAGGRITREEFYYAA
jgi:ketosteroid isomerase-like protein